MCPQQAWLNIRQHNVTAPSVAVARIPEGSAHWLLAKSRCLALYLAINSCAASRRAMSLLLVVSRTSFAPRLLRKCASLPAVSVGDCLCSTPREALDWGETDTTTILSDWSAAISSPVLWCSSKTVSADVTQPLQARQSCKLTLTASPDN